MGYPVRYRSPKTPTSCLKEHFAFEPRGMIDVKGKGLHVSTLTEEVEREKDGAPKCAHCLGDGN